MRFSLLSLSVRISAACLVIALSATSVDARDRFYRPVGPLGGSGYGDKQLSPNTWRVRTKSVNRRGEDIALPMAMYRAALLAKRAGYPFLQIVKSDLSYLQAFVAVSEEARITVIGVKSADAPLRCENKGQKAQACRTLPTDETMRTAGAALRHSPAEIAEDLAATTLR